MIARWFALQARHSATACYVKSGWRDGAMCDATVKQYNVLQCPYPDTVFIFGNINTSSTQFICFSVVCNQPCSRLEHFSHWLKLSNSYNKRLPFQVNKVMLSQC